MSSLEEKIANATDEFFKQFTKGDIKPVGAGGAPARRDYYEDERKKWAEENSRSYPNGARMKLAIDADEAVKTLKIEFCRVKHVVDRLKAKGDSSRATMASAQYMNDTFYPTVEAIVRLNSADELLNSNDALRKLDEYAIIDGGSANGYTKAYVESMYADEIGATPSRSDVSVRACIRDITALLADGQIRTAVGKATKMLDAIDSGKNMADDGDYAIIQKVATR